MARVRTSSAAEEDIRDALLYIGREDRRPEGALKLYQVCQSALATYAANPHLSQLRPEIGPAVRLFACGTKSNPDGWVVIDRPIGDGIHVLRIFRASQNYNELF